MSEICANPTAIVLSVTSGADHNKGGLTGLSFWDLADPVASDGPAYWHYRSSKYEWRDYDSTPWWVCWQGRYAYVAGTGTGLHIVDVDPSNPQLVTRIPTADIGGFRINVCFAIGNLLVVARSDGNGLATFDIGDPGNQKLLHKTNHQVGYSMMFNGGRSLQHNPARI